MKAAVLRELDAGFTIEDVQLADVGPHEVRVRTKASGVCGSDVHVVSGDNPWELPIVLGHEPAGIVEVVGSDVRGFAPGDRVVACSSAFCGHCDFCAEGRTWLCGGMATMRGPDEPSRIQQDGKPIGQFAYISSFAEEMLLHENSLVRIGEEMPLDRACLLGCGVLTGVGAVLNSAQMRPGESAVVVGCGGVGLSAIQGCRIASAGEVIAIDTVEWKLELAQKLGATATILASEDDIPTRVQELTKGGVDYAFECIGNEATIREAIMMLRPGGTCFLIGLMPVGKDFSFGGFDLVLGSKKIAGSLMGSNQFRLDIPRLANFYLSGELKLDEMISSRVSLADINDTFEQLEQGAIARNVIVFD